MNIQTRFTDYKWMKAAKAFRMFFELPAHPGIASELTGKLEQNIRAFISHSSVQFVVDPCHVSDIIHKRGKFTLVLETVSETQNVIGPLLPAMVGEQLGLSIDEADAVPEKEQRRGTIDQRTLKGLHAAFFKNQKFCEFFSAKVGAYIKNEHECKQAFKKHLGVESCTEINQEDFDGILKEFNAWLNGAPSA